MKKLSFEEQHSLAKQNSYHSVIELTKPIATKPLLGVKKTPAIKNEWIQPLKEHFQQHTLDAMAYKGRAIDTAITNPLTGRCMTGSSSGTAVNVLLGINDLGVGTDGGGSVLYPAMAVNIYSVLLSGVDFICDNTKKSTDDISFRAGLGLMSFHKEFLQLGVTALLGKQTELSNFSLAGDRKSLEFFKQDGHCISVPESDDRRVLIEWIQEQFQKVDIILLKEAQIDICGYGDSVLGLSSPYFRKQQELSGKKIGKILNMVQASAYTVPDQEAGSGYFIIAKKGRKAFEIARHLFEQAPEARMPLFLDYFGS